MNPPRFFGNEGGDTPRDMERLYKTGASEPFGPGTDHKVFLKWCLPDCYDRSCCGAQSVTVTVRVKIENPNDETATTDLGDIFGTLIWGSGEGDGPDAQEMDFDVVKGASFVVQAYTLTVAMSYPPFGTGGVPTAAHPIVRVDITVAIGDSGKAGVSTGATRTIKVGTIAGGGNASATFAIPEMGVGARIVNTDPLVPTLEIRQKVNAAIATFVSVERVGKLFVSAVPVARGLGARFFDVNNFNAAVSNGTAIIFDLCPN